MRGEGIKEGRIETYLMRSFRYEPLLDLIVHLHDYYPEYHISLSYAPHSSGNGFVIELTTDIPYTTLLAATGSSIGTELMYQTLTRSPGKVGDLSMVSLDVNVMRHLEN